MKYLSICSGIEAASVAWHPLGWEPLAFSEIEPFPSAVLAHHWPDVPNLGDMTKHHEWNEETQSTCGIVQDDKAPLEFQNTLRHDAGAMGDDDGKTESSLCPLLMSDGSTSSGSRSRERSSEGNIVSSVQHQIASSGGRRMDDAGACLPIRKRIKFSEIDVLVGGTPCQAFSVAGLRNSLSDERGNLTLIYVNILNQIDEARNLAGRPPAICLWENVPGVLTTKDNAFGCFLGALAGEDIPLEPPGGKWKNAGYVRGPQRTIAWRILDAQYFGVAQRRRRVFVVASARDGFSPEQILFEFDGLRRDIAPSREAGQGITYDVAPCLAASGRGFERTGDTRGQDCLIPSVSPAITSKWAKGSGGPAGDECQNLVACHTTGAGFWQEGFGTLRAREQDSHENLVAVTQFGDIAEIVGALPSGGTPNGHGTAGINNQAVAAGHIIPVVVHGTQDPCTSTDTAFALGRNSGQENVVAFSGRARGDDGRGYDRPPQVFEEGIVGTIDTVKPHCVAFSCKDHGADAGEISPTLRSMSADQSHANGGGQVAIAFKPGQSAAARSIGAQEEIACTLEAGGGGNSKQAVAFKATHEVAGTMKACKDSGGWSNSADHAAGGYMAIAPPYAVRRLTPTECERLQGFPDGHTLIPWRNKPADQCPDGPRYKALGNSMAVPVMAWIGKRIQLINDICNSKLN